MRFGMKSSSSSRIRLKRAALLRRRGNDRELEGIVKTGEPRRAFRAIADIHVAHNIGARDAPKPDPKDFVYVTQRIGAGARKHTAEVRERCHLDVEMRCDCVKCVNLAAQFD